VINIIVIVALGALAGLGQAPQGLWIFTVLACAYWLLRDIKTPRAAFLHGWLFGLGYFGVTLRWIVSPFLVDPASTGWMAPFAILLMAIGAGLFWGLARWISHRLTPHSIAMAGLALIGAEIARSYIFTGFPWALLGHIWIDTPLAQIAAFGGPHLLTSITVGLAACGAWLVKRRYVAAAGPVLAVVGWVGLTLGPAPQNDGPVVRMVQPNAKQSEKWDPEKSQIFLDRMIAFTEQGDVPDLVVWPETAIPYLLQYAGPELLRVSEAARGAPTVLGINRSEGARYYNALLVVGQGGTVSSVYDKAHLVPFGEYVPGGDLLRKVGINGFSAMTGGGFTAGDAARTIEIEGIGTVRPLICYEGIFAEEIGTIERPRLMVLITNDAWFGADAGPLQHLAQARLRAIEQGIPMVRVANTGVSAMIDARGRVTAQIGMNEANFIDARLPDALSTTVFSRYGDWPVLGLLLAAFFGVAAGARRYPN
tara:strand:+ start:35610 stop:37049 length:1440 start_codon:yes stop_codon:yes gene_type:complete